MRSKILWLTVPVLIVGLFFLQGCWRSSDLVKVNEATRQAVLRTLAAQIVASSVPGPTASPTAVARKEKASPTKPIIATPAEPTPIAATSKPTPPTTPTAVPTKSKTPSPSSGGSKPAVVLIWHSYPPQLEKILDEATTAYMKDHPNVRIQVVKQPDIQEAITNISDATGYPDIIAFTSNNIGAFAESGTIIPLDQLIEKLKLPLRKELEPLAIEAVSYQGHVWAVPHALGGLAWVRNPQLATSVPKDIDEFLRQREEFEKKHPQDLYFVYTGRDNPYFDALWFYGEGGFYIDDHNKVGINTPGGIKGMYLTRRISQAIPPREIKVPPEELFSTGKLAWIITEGQILDQMREAVPIDLPQWPMLEDGKRAKPLITAWSFGIYAGSGFQPEALQVANGLAAKYIPQSLKNQVGFVPASKAFNDSLLASDRTGLLSKRILQVREGAPFPNSPAMDILWNPLANMWQAVLNGASIEETAKRAQKTVEDAIKGIWKNNP